MENKMRYYLVEAKKHGITVTEIIKKTGIGRTSFYDILNGKQIPKLDTAYKIANALNVNLLDVFPNIKKE